MDLPIFYRVLLVLGITDVILLLGFTYLIANDDMFTQIPLDTICDKIGKLWLLIIPVQLIAYLILATVFL